MNNTSSYGLWSLVILNSAIFLIFVFSFTKPKTPRDWRSFSAFSAFIVALYTEMYGFPLTIYLLYGWLSARFPGINLFTHDMGHVWYSVLGFKGDPHFNPIHLLSTILLIAGFILLSSAWDVLYKAQKKHILATMSLYAYVRHPQYVGFVIIMMGFLLQWPTIPTLIMFPILVFVYARLAKTEEKEMEIQFGETYKKYEVRTPAFFPKIIIMNN